MRRWQKGIGIALAAGFILGSFKGYVALWDDDDPEPKQIFPCPVSQLPEEDQAALERGVRARSEIELARILEDYLS